MLHLFEPAAARGSDRIRRCPAVPVLGAVAVGILWDRTRNAPFMTWWIGGLLAALLTLVVLNLGFRRLSATLLLVACVSLGGAWHHWNWSCIADNAVSNWATDRGRMVHISGKVLQGPLILTSGGDGDVSWRVPDRTVTLIECRQLIVDTETSIPVSGRVRLSVAGRLDNLAIGDLIDVYGVLLQPSEPSNPGEFDNRRWLRAQGLHASVVADLPEAVIVTGRERQASDWVAVVRSAVRNRAETLMVTHMRPRTASVAQSLLLGSRVDLDRELRRAFAESGTLHVLAISGMNVGLLWIWLWYVLRALQYSPRAALIAVLLLLPSYALATDANPPVVRATIVAVVMAFGQLIGRNNSQWNSLALAALLVLAWNPCDLFNFGAQLSFVAVGAILLIAGFLRSVRVAIDLDDAPVANVSRWRTGLRSLTLLVTEASVISIGVWVMTSPLIASQFHLVSPIGFMLNVLLSPLIALMFWLGYSFLLLGMVSSTLFGWLGWPFDLTLGWFLSAVEAAAKVNLGHSYVPAPPLWWVIGFYVLTLSLLIVDQWKGRVFWSARAALAWSVLGLAVSLRPGNTNEVSCTVLSVGHGLSVLVELPNGRTLLYDAGSMTGGGRAARTIEMAVWTAGSSRLDAIVISHADADHCNAVPELVEVIPVHTLFAHRTFLDWSQAPVAAAIERAAATEVTIRMLASGQQIDLDPNVTITVLHPTADFASQMDNANSVVLCLEYAGRRILLTGDLERDGMYRLLKSKPIDTDILLSPHHGSLTANPRDLARWATPEWLIVSCRDDAVRERLAANFGGTTEILTTAKHGAIRCRIRSDGEMLVEPFKQNVH